MSFKKGSGGKKSFCNTSIICTYSILLEWEPLKRQPLWFSCWPSFSHSETQCFLLTFPHSYDLYDTIMPCLQHRPSLVSTTNLLHSLIKISNYSITFAVGLLIKQHFYIMQFDCTFCLYLQINEILWLTKYDLNFRLEYFLIQVYISDFEVKVCLSDPISYYVRSTIYPIFCLLGLLLEEFSLLKILTSFFQTRTMYSKVFL